MPTWQYWRIYKMFHDPPGTPQNLRCVNCRYASAAGLFTLAAGSAYGVKRTIGPKFYIGCMWVAATVVAIGSGVIALRMAHEDNKWNEIQIRVTKDQKLLKANQNMLNA